MIQTFVQDSEELSTTWNCPVMEGMVLRDNGNSRSPQAASGILLDKGLSGGLTQTMARAAHLYIQILWK